MTKIKAGPIPLQNPLRPSCFIISLTAVLADSLAGLLLPLEEVVDELAATALVLWAVWTVQIGLVMRVVMDPAHQFRLLTCSAGSARSR